MADETSQEKTEEPTGKRLKDAKEKGQSAKSKDLNSLLILTFAGFSFISLGPTTFKNFGNIISQFLQFDYKTIKTIDATLALARQFAADMISVILPILFIIMIATILGPIILGGWVFSTKSLAPKMERLSPLKGIKRMFSIKSLMELVKSILKFTVVASVGILVWYSQIQDFLSIGSLPLLIAIKKAFSMLSWSFLFVSLGLIFIAAIDVPFQLFQHKKELKMTKQEVKDEFKETEGKPEVKAQIRRMQQEVAQRRMMQEVPKADVILTNPSHYAVALVYDEQGFTAPRLIAKGQDHMAIQIGKIAKSHQVPIMRLPPLARAIYYSTEVNHEIPKGLYIAVAQVLAYVFQLKRKDRLDDLEPSPDALKDLPIPEELQRDAKE